MAVRGRTPREGGDGGGYWRWLKVRPGTSGSGWVAGDIHAYPAHMGKPSVVCVKTLTGGRLNCELCASKVPVRDLGYLPFYRDDNVPCVLILHEYSFDLVEKIPHLSPILWGRRDDDDAESVYVKRHMAGSRYESTLPCRLRKQDITIATARYWKRPDLLPELARWFAGVTVAADESPPPELAARVADVTAKAGTRRQSSHRETVAEINGEPIPPLVTDTMRDMLKRNKRLAAALATNGKAE